MSDLLSASEVARQLGVVPETVVRWANEGRLSAVRLPSGRYRFRQTDLDDLLHPKEAS